MSPFVIFLDIDGVVYNTPNQEGVFKKAAELCPEERYSNRICSIAAAYFFNQGALKNLDYLISKIEQTTHVWVVISSSWREDRSVEELKTTFFGMHHFSKYIVDKTPEKVPKEEIGMLCCSAGHSEKYSSQCRASEIRYWLTQHPEVRNFVVLDDYDHHLSDSFGDRFIKTDYERLITAEIIEKILERSI